MTLSKPDSSATCGGWPRKTFAPQSSWLRKPTLRLKICGQTDPYASPQHPCGAGNPCRKSASNENRDIRHIGRNRTFQPYGTNPPLQDRRYSLLCQIGRTDRTKCISKFEKRAKEHDGYYSSFTRSFLFDTPEDAEAFRGTAPTSDATRPTSEEQPAIQHPLFDKAALVPVDSYSPKAYNMYRFYSARAREGLGYKNKVSFKMTKPANDSSTISVNWLNKVQTPLSG